MSTRVAAVMTVHNRRDMVLSCLASLRLQARDDFSVEPYVVDDGSTDGTTAAIREHFPDVTLIPGDGTLYWNGGMRKALAAAAEGTPDFFLWMNDDTVLFDGAVELLVRTYRQLAEGGHSDAIVTGTTRHPDTGALTYGGVVRLSRWRPLQFELVPPGDVPLEVETMNGNCVLVPAHVAEKVGNLEQAYIQKMGDFDYGWRARRLGCSVWVAPGVIGTCASHPPRRTDQRPLAEELRRLWSVKELPPRAWKVFTKRWAGPMWPIYWVSPYIRGCVRLVAERVSQIFGSRYLTQR